MQDFIATLFNRFFAAIGKRVTDSELATMSQGYDLSVGLHEAADAIAGVTATVITAASGGSLVATGEAQRVYTYSGTHVVPAATVARIVFGGFGVFPGAKVELSIDGTVVVNETMDVATKYFDLADLATGSHAVILKITEPAGTRSTITTDWFLRSEKLV